MPILFVKLTGYGTEAEIHVNLTNVTKMYRCIVPGCKPRTAVYSYDDSPVYVTETPDDIMRKALEVINYGDDGI